jgi:hypothetical protein
MREWRGSFTAGACDFFLPTTNAEGTELMVCKRGMEVAYEAKVYLIISETDSTEVAAKLLKEDQD